jgi:hypothetical protein
VSTGFTSALEEELGKFIVENTDAYSATVLAWRDDTEIGGYCETCRYTEAILWISYKDQSGKIKEYKYYGDFGDLIRELTD